MKESIELNQEPTTIWIKKGTKRMLDEMGGRKDTYDDILRRLIEQSGHGIEAKAGNRILISKEKTQQSSLLLDDGRIDYVYTVPEKPIRPEFRFRISYLKIVYKGKEYRLHENYREGGKDTKASIGGLAKDYLRVVEQVIRTTVDSLFKIDGKRILDLEWWKRKLDILGLPAGIFEEDIKLELLKLGVHP